MTREEAFLYVSYCIDAALGERAMLDKPLDPNTVLVGWQCGFEPMFVAVYSYLPNVSLDAAEAEELATEYLQGIGWFAEEPTPADYVL